jgi:TatD DNase family protein
MLIDTHCHAYVKAFDADREEVMARAHAAGVERLLLPNIDVESIPQMRALLEEQPGVCFPMMGLHPCHVEESWQEDLKLILRELDVLPCVAVGEIGLDLYWDKNKLELQKAAARVQIAWALERDLPVVLHVRDAFAEMFALLDEFEGAGLHGVFHCFNGGVAEAERVAGFPGFYYGLGGVSTFKNAGMDLVIPGLDRSRVVLETDSPYLAPVPHRGKRNEPAYTALVAQRVADLWECSLAEVGEVTTANAERLFKLASK